MQKVFECRLKHIDGETIKVLKVSDYNTTGIIGSQNIGKVKSNWNALIYDEGNNQKPREGSMGSFGTGKNSPFALSKLKMIFYVTKDVDGYYATEGVARLHTSLMDGYKYEGKAYYAKLVSDNPYPLNEDESKKYLPDFFKRQEIGSDIIVMGIDFEEDKIKNEIMQAIIENFFVLIAEGKLQIQVFGERVNDETVWMLLEKYCSKPLESTSNNIKYGFAKQYLNLYCNNYETKIYEEDVTGAGKLKLYIAKGENISGKYVAMVRKNGMKIFDRQIRAAQQEFTAIFMPGSDDVNNFLRDIENPTHDKFDPEIRIDDKDEKDLAIKRYDQIDIWIRNKVEEYTKVEIKQQDFLEGMEEYLQLEDDKPDASKLATPIPELIEINPTKREVNPNIETTTDKGNEQKAKYLPGEGGGGHKSPGVRTGTEFGKDGKGIIKDYYNKFKVTPHLSTKGKELKVAFSLDEYDGDTFNIEITTIGEDNLTSDYMPKIIKAKDLFTDEELKIYNGDILDIPLKDTNMISLELDRPLAAKYKVSIYKKGDDDFES